MPIPQRLWSATTPSTSRPQLKIFSALTDTIPLMIITMDTTEISGSTSDIFWICFPKIQFIKIPRRTGISTTFTTEITIARKDTSTQAPASRYTNNGVISGAASVEVIVIPTESATSPPAIYVITLLAVPPGQHPTRITPSARSVGRCISWHNPHATTGMIVYCATNPITISFGLEKTLLKSSILIVSPMPNMATPKKMDV